MCCQRMDKVKKTIYPWDWMNKLVADFPYDTDEAGQCEMLIDGQCSVYEMRPMLCNIERIADMIDIGMNKETWFEINYRGCESLQKAHVVAA